MDAFAFLNDDAAADSHHVCYSTDDIRKQLDELLLSKTSETKAEHVDTKFKFPTTANFLVVVNEAENATLESAASLNGGVRPFAGHNQTVLALGNGQYQRQITTHDAIVNQPQDDPVLQRAVAKQIAGALSSPGEVASSWNVRTIARASSGWTFEYVCKDSLQVWQRQHAKEVLPVVGLSSGKDGQNPTLLSRPAFDCRGSLTIHFERTNKEIEVKYSHTPLHKTVAELYEMFTPPPEPTLAQKRAVPTTDGETATPAKKKKKKRKTGTNSTDGKGETTEGSIIVVGGPPGEIPAGDGAPDASQATPSTKKKRTPRPKKPKATVEDHSAVVKAQDSANTAASAVNVHVLDLPPGEADRRRDRANGLLVVSGIDPATLSEEQFDIFSNQSPELQRESLVMLVKYGAERLRIVHPNKDAQASTPPTPSTPASAASSAATASSDAGTAGSTTKNKKKKSVTKSLAGAESGEDATPSGTKKQKLTRGKCDPCRDAKTPCSKSKPSCEQCRMADIECHYRPEVPTGPRGNAKPEEPVESKPEPVVAEIPPLVAATPPLVAAMPPAAEEEEPDDLPSPGFGQQSTAMDWTSTQAQAQAQAQAETTDENVSSYQSQPAEESSEQTLTTSTIEYPQHTGFASQATHAPQVPEAVMQEPAQPQWPGREVAPIHQATGLSKTGRRSLPTGQHAQPKVADNPAPDGSTSWANSSNPPPPTQPVQVQGQDTANHGYQAHTRSRSQTSSMNSTEFGFQGHAQGLREDAALSQAAIQRPSQASPPTQPSQPVRTSSRQSQRPPGSREYQSAAISNSSDYPPSTVSASYSSMGTAAQDPHAQYYGDSSSNNNNNNSDTYTSTSTTQAGGSTSNDTTHSSHTSVPASNNTTVYASYDNNYSTHNVSSHRPTTQTYSNPATQATSTSYASSAASNSSNQWPSATAQVHSSKSYNNNSATAVASRTAQTASMSQSSATHGFNVRPSSPQATRSSVRASYHQQQPPSQQHLQESRSQPQTQQTRQRQPQQQQSYASYGRQQQSTSSQNQHQQQQQQGWYGYVATDSNPAGYRGVVNPQQAVNGGYDASHAGNSTSHGSQHRSMNISDNNYGHMDANDTLYSLVQNSHGR
ncbi:hypothetical protein PpBr36_01030 [Pyricularia pennisetigena]|uniref:hypothetical protein n=1 Tax=Pyricularia pennisetigena TaxID=1578925 RepID=UPI0011523471|nr:hypothetical protein PpBr36_01030 [Pyricularia pennisetigena]TLS27705.1 hypothetical protein PpBr36_01030 [Pyricularia pennisetigena]